MLRHLIIAAVALFALVGAAAAEQRYTAAAFAAAQKSGKSVIVHVYAPWCPTCQAQEPILQKLEADPRYSGVEAFRVDFDNQKDAVRAMKATNQSTIIVFKGGKEVGRSVGETSPQTIGALVAKSL